MTSDQLKGLNLNKGVNTISFTVTSRLQGTATCTSKIFLWEHDTRVVISDVDGTITKSDVLGHVFTMVGQDWTHSGVASLYTNIRKNDYQILYLTSRAIGQANYTRDYLKKVDQDKFKLPEGPVVMSPDRLFTAFHREVIQRRPEEFKIACLRDIQRLFGPNARPFYAGFGNRITDVQSYRAVQVPLSRIFTIDPSGEIKLEFTKDYKSSYVKLNEIVDRIFPPVSENVEVGDGVDVEGNDWNMWKQYLPEAVANMNAEAKKESGGDMDVPDESSAVANVNEPSATVPSESNIVTVSKGKEATLVVESTANESGAVEIEYEDYEDGESEEYDEDEEADEGTALDNTVSEYVS
ncbi:Lipin/Ned1/Smp2-domain-containing protein [Chytriomyces sp. MP71]|nr:Lipin/Ned1/Smp2-domain-containing protein [Chytriomyces sp. MP71]